jgi:cellulase/cellobiase CelA1
VVSSWPGAYQGSVTLTNTGSRATSRWTAFWTFGDSQVITQLWGGEVSQSGAAVTVNNVSWNAVLNPGASVTFGFLANAGTTNRIPADITCSTS